MLTSVPIGMSLACRGTKVYLPSGAVTLVCLPPSSIVQPHSVVSVFKISLAVNKCPPFHVTLNAQYVKFYVLSRGAGVFFYVKFNSPPRQGSLRSGVSPRRSYSAVGLGLPVLLAGWHQGDWVRLEKPDAIVHTHRVGSMTKTPRGLCSQELRQQKKWAVFLVYGCPYAKAIWTAIGRGKRVWYILSNWFCSSA